MLEAGIQTLVMISCSTNVPPQTSLRKLTSPFLNITSGDFTCSVREKIISTIYNTLILVLFYTLLILCGLISCHVLWLYKMLFNFTYIRWVLFSSRIAKYKQDCKSVETSHTEIFILCNIVTFSSPYI